MSEFGSTDLTRYVLRTKNAPLSASGTHEIVATAEYKATLIALAKSEYGSAWRRTFEIVKKEQS